MDYYKLIFVGTISIITVCPLYDIFSTITLYDCEQMKVMKWSSQWNIDIYVLFLSRLYIVNVIHNNNQTKWYNIYYYWYYITLYKIYLLNNVSKEYISLYEWMRNVSLIINNNNRNMCIIRYIVIFSCK